MIKMMGHTAVSATQAFRFGNKHVSYLSYPQYLKLYTHLSNLTNVFKFKLYLFYFNYTESSLNLYTRS